MVKPKKDKNLKYINGKWYIDFTSNKKRIRKFGGRTKGQAIHTLELLRSNMKTEKILENFGIKKVEKKPDILFEDFSKEFMDLYSKQHKKSWERDEESLKHLKPFLKEKTLQEIGPELIENYKLKRKAEKTKKKSKVSESTINRELALLKTIFNKAVEWGKIDTNRLIKVKKFKEKQKPMKILKDEEAIRLIDFALPHLKPVLIVVLNTGMRKGEILSLKWENIDFKNGLIFVKDSKSADREVPINYLVFETLKELPRIAEFIFYNPKTNSHIKDVKNSFRTARNNAKIKGLIFHDLRHTAASRMIQAGVDLVTVSRILGHSSIQMTTRYIHPTTEIMRNAVAKLGKIYEQTRQKVDSPTIEVEIKKPVSRLSTDN